MIAQRPIAELARGADRHKLIVEVDDQQRTLALLRAHERVREAQPSEDGLRVALAGAGDAAAVNAMLVGAGIAVSRLDPYAGRSSSAFLEVTSKLGDGDSSGLSNDERDRATVQN